MAGMTFYNSFWKGGQHSKYCTFKARVCFGNDTIVRQQPYGCDLPSCCNKQGWQYCVTTVIDEQCALPICEMPTDIYWKKSQKKRSKIQRKCGEKKKTTTSCCKGKKKSSRTEILIIYSASRNVALYIYQSIGRHSITGEASFFYDRHGNGQTIHRHAQRSHCSFEGNK